MVFGRVIRLLMKMKVDLGWLDYCTTPWNVIYLGCDRKHAIGEVAANSLERTCIREAGELKRRPFSEGPYSVVDGAGYEGGRKDQLLDCFGRADVWKHRCRFGLGRRRHGHQTETDDAVVHVRGAQEVDQGLRRGTHRDTATGGRRWRR